MFVVASVVAVLNAPALPDHQVGTPPPAIESCSEQLTAAGVRISAARIPVHPSASGDSLCGAPQVVRYRRGPTQVRWSSSPKATCQLALAIARFEHIVAEEAAKHLRRKVRRIHHIGGYSCREMAAYPGWQSEHAFVNALDIRAFELSGGHKITVRKHYPRSDDDLRPEAQFFRAVAERAYDEDVFSVVLTPAFDALHAGHLHFDMAPYRVDGTGRDEDQGEEEMTIE